MSSLPNELRGLPSARQLRLVLACRELRDPRLCEQLTFAFARSGGVRGADVWYVAACAMALAGHAVERGGGELELRSIDLPRRGVQLTLRHGGPALTEPSARLERARHYVHELSVEWHAADGATDGADDGSGETVVIARQWLQAAK